MPEGKLGEISLEIIAADGTIGKDSEKLLLI